jgi:arginine decarboxylase
VDRPPCACSKGAGKWATSGGEHAKFGLSTAEILEAIEIMEQAGMSSRSSSSTSTSARRSRTSHHWRAVREAAMYYAKLYKSGHRLEYVDVGGGLAIDYDGSRTTFHSSMNYTVEEYASDIVYNILDICDDEKVPHPIIVSESGRATVAHHSVLVVQAFGAIEKTPLESREIQARDHKLVRERSTSTRTSRRKPCSPRGTTCSRSRSSPEHVRARPARPDVKARVESLFWQLAERMELLVRTMDPEEVPRTRNLKIELADQHICNSRSFNPSSITGPSASCSRSFRFIA